MTLQDYINQVQLLVHDQQALDFTVTELTQNINNARNAVALDFHCVRGLYSTPFNNPGAGSPVSLIQNQESYPLISPNNNVQVVGATIAAGGSGYTGTTTVTFAAPPAGGVQATGVPVIANGALTQINMTAWGQGYTPGATPSVTISGAGSGAAATAVVFTNVFNVVSISNIWGNQRYMLKYLGFSLFQAYMRSQNFFTQRPLIWTLHQESGTILVQPPPDQAYISEWDVVMLPRPLVNASDSDTQVIQPWADAVQYYAAMLCLLKLQNFQQADFMNNLYKARVPRLIIGANEVRYGNPYSKVFQRRVMRR